MTKKIYLAAPFFDEEQLDRVRRVEAALAKNPQVGDVFSPRLHQEPTIPFGSLIWQERIFSADVTHLANADVVVAIADFEGHHVDSGTAFEIGYAFHAKIPMVLIHEKVTQLNLMLAQSLVAHLTAAQQLVDYDFNHLPASRYEGPVI